MITQLPQKTQVSQFVKIGDRSFKILFPELFPPIRASKEEQIRRSILNIGIQGQILVDTTDGVLDGANLLRICSKLIEDGDLDPEDVLERVVVREKVAGDEQLQLQIATDLNAARRQLTEEEEKKYILDQWQKGKPQRAIAEEIGKPKSTVNNWCRKSQELAPEEVVGKDGKRRKATRSVTREELQDQAENLEFRIQLIKQEVEQEKKDLLLQASAEVQEMRSQLLRIETQYHKLKEENEFLRAELQRLRGGK
jgi:transposase